MSDSTSVFKTIEENLNAAREFVEEFGDCAWGAGGFEKEPGSTLKPYLHLDSLNRLPEAARDLMLSGECKYYAPTWPLYEHVLHFTAYWKASNGVTLRLIASVAVTDDEVEATQAGSSFEDRLAALVKERLA